MKKTCLTCNQIFSTNRSKRKFCSITCSNKFRYHERTRICKFCNEIFKVHSKNIENIFCSNTCYFKSKEAKKTNSICETCKKEFIHPDWSGHKFTFCSNECRHKRGKNVKYRKYALQLLENQCSCCIEGKGRLEVHHIDFNRSNNKIDNLCIVCHSCHLRIHALIKRSGLEPSTCFDIMKLTDLHRLNPNRFRSLWKHANSGKFIISIDMDLSYYLR